MNEVAMTEKVVPKNISLYPEDWEIVEQETGPMGMKTSQGVRYIIREWLRFKKGAGIGPQKRQEATEAAFETEQVK
jgi:hypothetical protein